MENNSDNFIKHMGPKKNSRYNQGQLDPNTCKKYFSDCKDEPIIYRSGLELQFIKYCEANPSISRWASEPIEIKYISRVDKKQHRYYPDYVIQDKNGNRIIVEIKPNNQTTKPAINASLWAKKEYIRNVDKWNAAKIFAEKNNMKFLVITENFLGNLY